MLSVLQVLYPFLLIFGPSLHESAGGVLGYPYSMNPISDTGDVASNGSTTNVSSLLDSVPGKTMLVESGLNCFPALKFRMPSSVPSSTDGWWCDKSTEYAFVGFSYEVTACQSLSQLEEDFRNIRDQFNGRYVRLYGACDNDDFYDDIIEAAWTAGIGVHALIWFGFDGTDQWMTRRDSLISTLNSNSKAPFVTRVVQFGSEPLFDSVLSPTDLANQVWGAKAQLANVGIPVTVSDMAYSYQKNDGAPQVIEAIDLVDAHMFPFFSQEASTASNSWLLVLVDLHQ